MSFFLIRIQLKHTDDEKSAIYDMLRKNLAAEHIYNCLQHPGNKEWYELPRATYFTNWYSGTNAQNILDIVNKIIKTSIRELRAANVVTTNPPIESQTIVTEAGGNLPFATDFPKTSSPA